MTTYVVDASALLRFIEDEPGAARVEELLNQARNGNARIVVSAVNWGEVFYLLARAKGEDQAVSYSIQFRNLPVEIIPSDWHRAESAGLFREKLRLPHADSFAGSLAAEQSAVLVTADYDFKKAADAITVEFLPVKPKRRGR